MLDTAEPTETLKRTLEMINSERSRWKQRNNTIDVVLRQTSKALCALLAELKGYLSTQPELPQASQTIIQGGMANAEQRLTQLQQRLSNQQAFSTERKLAKQYAREAINLMESIIREATRTPENGMSDQLIDLPISDNLMADSLLRRLQEQRIIIQAIELEQKQKADVLQALYRLSLLVHRTQRLLLVASKFDATRLQTLAMQLMETAQSVQLHEDEELNFLQKGIERLEESLEDLEAEERRTWLRPVDFRWAGKRLKKLQRQETTQGRILAGLLVSLVGSGVIFISLTSITTILSTFSTVSQNNARLRKIDTYKALAKEVDSFIGLHNSKQDTETDLATLQESIATAVSIRDEAEDAKTPAGQEQYEKAKASLEELNKQRLTKDNEKGDRDQLYNQSFAKLTTLGAEIKANEAELLSSQSPGTMTGTQRLRALIINLANAAQDPTLLKHSRRLTVAAFAGALGSIMSILIRLDKMEEENLKNPFMVGALKPIIGAVFGVIVFMILTTNVIDFMPANFRLHNLPPSALPQIDEITGSMVKVQDPLGDIDSQELYKIFLVAFLAGFSERLASDTLQSVGKSKN